MIPIPRRNIIEKSTWHDSDGHPWLFQSDFPEPPSIQRWRLSNGWDEQRELVYTYVGRGLAWPRVDDDIVLSNGTLTCKINIIATYPASGFRMGALVERIRL